MLIAVELPRDHLANGAHQVQVLVAGSGQICLSTGPGLPCALLQRHADLLVAALDRGWWPEDDFYSATRTETRSVFAIEAGPCAKQAVTLKAIITLSLGLALLASRTPHTRSAGPSSQTSIIVGQRAV